MWLDAVLKFFKRRCLLQDSGLLWARTLDLCLGILLHSVDWLTTELTNGHLLARNGVVLNSCASSMARLGSCRSKLVLFETASHLCRQLGLIDLSWSR